MKIVTIQFYNEAVAEYDVEVWLRRHCEILSESKRVNDEDGVWTGARRWQVRLQVEVAAIGGVRHLPSTVVLGANRGLVFYLGMPKLCRNCGALGNLAAACTDIKCKVCGGEHLTRACKQERAGNLCSGGGHLFRNCPSSYANRARALRGSGEEEKQVVAPPKETPQDGGREESVLRSVIDSLSDCGSEVEAEGESTVPQAWKRRRAEKRSVGRGGAKSKRINTSLLDDPLDIKTFSRHLKKWRTLRDLFDSPIEWWEMVKKRTKGYFIQLGKWKACESRARYSYQNTRLQPS
ncbi:ZCHC3 protein, partial [Amia calva]|nr:ZCHC3 protein [Amia calva]MBN3307392.1 ZCHC3 protein [Amia calva]